MTFTHTVAIKWRTRSSGSWTPVFDYMLALLGIFMILAITEKPKATPMRIETLGLYAVQMTWPTGSNDDIDLWTQDPKGNIAWYGSLTAGGLTLQGDVLGCASSTGYYVNGRCYNLERTLVKQAVPGEYTVNVHAYSKVDARPVKVVVELWELRGHDRLLRSTTITLRREAEEETAFRFTLDAQGDVSSFNTLPKKFVGSDGTAG